jgi:hypothetical protein
VLRKISVEESNLRTSYVAELKNFPLSHERNLGGKRTNVQVPNLRMAYVDAFAFASAFLGARAIIWLTRGIFARSWECVVSDDDDDDDSNRFEMIDFH